MIMKIYLARDNVQAGPYTLDELNRMLSSKEVIATDLMWHAGMSEWKTVGEMTNHQAVYRPNTSSSAPSIFETQENRGFGDNVDFKKDEKRVSVAELYGRQPSEDTSVLQTKTTTTIMTKNTQKDDGRLEYASVFLRFLAFVINMGLYFLALLPLITAFMQVVDVNEIAKHAQDYASMQVYSQSLVAKIPKTTVMMSNLMFFGLLAIQMLLIVVRGQSFGKLVMGIRVIDEKTGKLPNVGTLIFMRTLFLITVYVMGAMLLSGLPAMIMLGVNYIMANGNDKKQGWHDKLTKTLVVKAKPSQLDKSKDK